MFTKKKKQTIQCAFHNLIFRKTHVNIHFRENYSVLLTMLLKGAK